MSVGIGCIGYCNCLIGNVRKCQFILASCGYRQREISLRVGDNAHAVLLNANTDVFHALTPFINNVTFDRCLCLSRHCDEGEDNSDDGLLVHCFFVCFISILFAEISSIVVAG